MSLPLATRLNGQVIDQTWFNQINDELVLLNSRFNSFIGNETIEWVIGGSYGQSGIKDQYLAPFIVPKNITVTAALLKLLTAGASGGLEIDIEFKRGAGAWTTIFNQLPRVPSSAGSFADSDTGTGATAAIINTVVEDLLAGDLLRLNVDVVPDSTADGFIVTLDYTVAGT